MKWDRHKGWSWLLVLLAVLLGLWGMRETVVRPIPLGAVKFMNPRELAIDGSGKAFIVSDQYKRILGVREDGSLENILRSRQMGKQGFYWADNVEMDTAGELYVSHQILDPEVNTTVASQIIRYDASGSFREVLVEEAAFSDYRLMLHPVFQVREDALYFIRRMPDERSGLYSLKVSQGEESLVAVLPCPFEELQWFDVEENGGVWYTTFGGGLRRFCPESGEEENLLEAYPEVRVPADVLCTDTRTLVLDLEGNRILELGGPERLKLLVDEGVLKAGGYPYPRMLLRTLEVAPDGTLHTLDILNGTWIRYSPETGKTSWVASGIPSSPMLLGLGVYGLGIVIVLCILTGFCVQGLRRIGRSIYAKQLSAFLGWYLLSVLFFTVMVYNQLDKSYQKELEHRVLGATQAGAARMDLSAYLRIQGPDADRELVDAVREALDVAIFDAEDPWNEDFYSEAYRIREGNFYLDPGGYYKYNDVTPVHREAYEKGTIGFVRYTDAYGTWIGGVAPLKDDGGRIVGVFECYLDASLLSQRKLEFLTHSLGMAALFVTLFVVLFMLYAHYELKPIRRLQQAVASIAGGEYDVQVEVKRSDEVGALSRGFNEMAVSLNRYREKMESLVEDRTEALNQKLRELALAHEALGEAYRKLEGYSATVEELSVTKERNRIARELHDSISQELYGLSLALGTASRIASSANPEVQGMMDRIIDTLGKVQNEMRLLIYELRPGNVEALGLAESVAELADMFMTRFGISIRVDVEAQPFPLALSEKYALYRILQEALNNVVRHARAEQVEVRLRTTGEGVEMTVRDDGIGMGLETGRSGAIGLQSMRERAEEIGGVLTVETAVGAGTCIRVVVPPGNDR